MAVYVERNNTFKRLLERHVEELQTELKCRLLQIEQTQYDILKTFGNKIEIIAKYSYTLSPKKRRKLLSEMNLHYTTVHGNSGAKQTILKHHLSERDILSERNGACLQCGSQNMDAQDTGKQEHQCELCSFRSKTLMNNESKIVFRDDGHSDGFMTGTGDKFKRGTSFSEKLFQNKGQIDTSLKRNISFTTVKDPQVKPELEGANVNLTAFAFSRYSQNYHGAPLKRRTFESPNNKRLKRGIRTKVVQNYLLCDVFKRLSDRNNSLARMKIEKPEGCSDKDHYTCDVVKNLQKCRYLRVPKALQETDEEKMTKIDID